jgi:hypothetical protein
LSSLVTTKAENHLPNINGLALIWKTAWPSARLRRSAV